MPEVSAELDDDGPELSTSELVEVCPREKSSREMSSREVLVLSDGRFDESVGGVPGAKSVGGEIEDVLIGVIP